jgi:transcriptional regulator with XRE-family HTH domain
MEVVLTVGHEPDAARRIRRRQGEKIRRIRVMREMSIHELAAAVGVSDGAISQWETGRFAPRQDKQVAIAKALDVPWSTIFDLDGEVA